MSPRITWINGSQEPDVHVYVAGKVLQCVNCRKKLAPTDRATRSGKRYLCMTCSGLDELKFLPVGSTSITGLAMGFTGKKVLVFRKSKKSIQRIGILATEEAIRKATEKSEALAQRKAKAA